MRLSDRAYTELKQLILSKGFGEEVLSERALVSYLCTAPYDPSADAAIRWNDATLAIDWPVAAPVLSAKDAKAPFLDDIPPERLPSYAP